MRKYRRLEDRGEPATGINYTFVAFNIILCILALFMVSQSFAHHYILTHPAEDHSYLERHSICLVVPPGSESLLEPSPEGDVITDFDIREKSLLDSGELKRSIYYFKAEENEDFKKGDFIQKNYSSFKMTTFNSPYGGALMKITDELYSTKVKRHAGHHDEEYDYELYQKLIMKLKEFEIDELPFTRMEERNDLSLTVIKIDKTQGIEIYIKQGHSEEELLKDSFIVLENENDDIINIIHSGRRGYLGMENALQVMVNFISFGSKSFPNQEGRFHVFNNTVCHESTADLRKIAALQSTSCSPTNHLLAPSLIFNSTPNFVNFIQVHKNENIKVSFDSNHLSKPNYLLL